MDNIIQTLERELAIPRAKIQATIELIDQGNTIPFIARYRKEATGNLDDEILRKLNDRLTYLKNLATRKDEITKHIEELGEMTEALKQKIAQAKIQAELEDIYRPYKPKKRTKATIAKEMGLEPLAKEIVKQTAKTGTIEQLAIDYINAEKGVTDTAIAIFRCSRYYCRDDF